MFTPSFLELLPDLWLELGRTGLMMLITLPVAILIGGPLGVCLLLTSRGYAWQRGAIHKVLDLIVNLVRSFPFIILMVALSPMTHAIVKTSIGPVAAAVPLSVAAIAYFARLVEQALREVPKGLIEAAQAMGASTLQIVFKVLIVEARSSLVLALTILTVSFLSYSAVAGVVGGGGVGDFAIRYGYYRFQTDIMIATVLILVVIVQVIQSVGNWLARRLDKR